MLELTKKEIDQLKKRSEVMHEIERKWQNPPDCACGGKNIAYLFAENYCKSICNKCKKKTQHGEIK
jgi:hypothetical protein